ncbi:hypothetical protein BDZ90DRAFT_260451 [Jaminaea rosea]|uniref:Ribosome biogenesis protein SLX9 n=1 Tax=Jaminaea rosea TaxID=1569628 RepID=A0A316UPX6_9BASI|nr:hypothetical protein BDZ90DRAFT_260451 [Jaminaea rosea]PWN27362.1 hypothetical protein BDZ90DRAFT_260451 [Jaminaea rosea]
MAASADSHILRAIPPLSSNTMARLPAISGRPAPKRKHDGPSSPAAHKATQAQVTKAAKRTLKRQQLVATAKAESDQAKPSYGLKPTISKSALRRRKRKTRDEAVLGQGGLEGMREEIEELDDDDDGGEDDIFATAAENHQHGSDPRSYTSASSSSGANKVGSKLRRRVLAQEQLRQPHILRDLRGPASGGKGAGLSAFAAIREHARNTMPAAPAHRQQSSKKPRDGDVAMS